MDNELWYKLTYLLYKKTLVIRWCIENKFSLYILKYIESLKLLKINFFKYNFINGKFKL
jgi:hypothetical protein